MSQKLSVNDFKWVENISEFNEGFIKSYEGQFLVVDAQHPENLHNIHNDLPFFSEKMKIEKVKKLLAKLHDKKEFVIHVRNLKQALNQGIVLKKVHRIVKFNQRASLKPHFDMNTDLRKTAKNDFDKDFF